jgi:hypothetical protein
MPHACDSRLQRSCRHAPGLGLPPCNSERALAERRTLRSDLRGEIWIPDALNVVDISLHR